MTSFEQVMESHGYKEINPDLYRSSRYEEGVVTEVIQDHDRRCYFIKVSAWGHPLSCEKVEGLMSSLDKAVMAHEARLL